MMKRSAVVLGLAAAASCAAPALAAETITYSQDARAGWSRVQRTGPVNKTTTYQLDKADNRIVNDGLARRGTPSPPPYFDFFGD